MTDHTNPPSYKPRDLVYLAGYPLSLSVVLEVDPPFARCISLRSFVLGKNSPSIPLHFRAIRYLGHLGPRSS